MKITFVLPARGTSGGIRVTVKMAILLLAEGYDVRIVWHCPSIFSKEWLLINCRTIAHRIMGFGETDWLKYFDGRIQSYNDLAQINFDDGEIVIAVGTSTIEDVFNIKQPVIKIRYCHGFLSYMPELMKRVWSLPMNTITVSSTLVPMLEQYSGDKVLDVVPNGLDTNEYYDEKLNRDGIGMIYSTHPSKRSVDVIKLIKSINSRWPSLPLNVFGYPRRPREISKKIYWRYPSVSQARQLYSRSKIWLITSQEEGFGLPALEAMACGSAVISTDNLGSLEIIEHEKNGFLVPVGDIDGFMKYIDFLLHHEEKRIQLVNESKEVLKRFTWEKAVKKMEDVLRSVAAN